METTERVARARFRQLENIDSKFLCCEEMRAKAQAVAGALFDVFPGQAWRDHRVCVCGVVHEVTAIRMAQVINNCTCVAVDFIDIDEGAE